MLKVDLVAVACCMKNSGRWRSRLLRTSVFTGRPCECSRLLIYHTNLATRQPRRGFAFSGGRPFKLARARAVAARGQRNS